VSRFRELTPAERERVQRFIKETAKRFGAPPAEITLRRQQGVTTMTEYDNRNRGVLFNDRDKKTKDGDRDYSGSINIDGVEFWLSAWIKTSQKGVKFMSLSVKPKQEKPAEGEKKSLADDFADSIPF
jgi:hypothetical protein